MIDSIYKQISDIIIWYKEIGINTQDINKLLEYKDMLAISSYMLAEFAATKKIDYNIAYFVRKVSVIREYVHELQNIYFSINGKELKLK
jgi:uncharacterized lipoprotein YehR (DUF1307 family)